MIRTNFGGTPEDVGDSNISPTSVMDFRPSLKNNKPKGSDEILIHQLKRRMTVLEHEKANMEKDLMNQINTVVFDKDTMVGALEDKVVEIERRYKEERQAHSETKCTLRQQRFSDAGEAKFEIFRLQDTVQEISDEKTALESEVEQLKSEKSRNAQSTRRLQERIREVTEAKNNLQYELDKLMTENEEASQAFLSQLTGMEETHKAQLDALKKEQEKRICEIEQKQAAVLAELERDLFQRHQNKLLEVEQTHKKVLKTKDSEISSLTGKLQKEESANRDLKTSFNETKQLIDPQSDDEATSLQSEIMSLVDKLSRSEAENMNLRDSLQRVNETNAKLQSSLEDNQQKTSDYVTIFEEERGNQKEKIDSLSQQLDEEKEMNSSLKEQLEALKTSYDETCRSNEEEKESLLKQINGVREQLSDRENMNKRLKDRVADLESANSDLHESMADLAGVKTELQTAQAEKESLEVQIKDFHDQVEEGNDAIEMLKESITDFETDNAELRKSQEQKDSTITRLREERDSLRSDTSEKNVLLEQLEDLRAQVDESKTFNGTLQASVADLKTSNSNLRSAQQQNESTITRLEEEKDQLSTQNKDLRELIDVARLRESTLNTTVKEQQDKLSDLEWTLKTRSDTIDSLEQELQGLRDQIVQEQTTNANLMDSLGEEVSSKSELYASQSQKDSKIQELEKERNELLEELEDIKEVYKHAKETLTSTEFEKSQILEGKTKLEGELEALSYQLEERNEALKSLENSLQQEQYENRELLNVKHSLTSECTRLQQENESNLSRLEKMSGQLENEKELARSSRVLLEDRETAIEELKTVKDEKACAWQKQCVIYHLQATMLQRLVEEHDATLLELRFTIGQQNTTIAECQKKNEDFQNDRLALLDRISSLEGSLERAQNNNKSREDSNSVLTSEAAEQEKHIPLNISLRASLEGARRQIETLEGENASLLGRLNPQTGNDKKPNESFSSIDGNPYCGGGDAEEEIARLAASVECLEDDNMELRSALEEHADIKASIQVLLGKKRELLSEIDDLYSQLRQQQKGLPDPTASLEEEQMYSIVQATMDDQRTKDDTIKELQNDVDKLHAELDELKSARSNEIERLEAELDDQKVAREQLESESLSQVEIIKNLEAEIAATEDTKTWLEKSLDEVEELRGEVSKTSAALEEAKQQNHLYCDKIEELESDLFTAKQSMAINEEEIERLQDLLAQKEPSNVCEGGNDLNYFKAEVERLKSTVEQTESRRMDREAKLKVAYKREVSQYRERIEAFENQLLEEKEALQKELESEKKHRSTMNEEVIRLASQLSATKQALEAIQEEKSALKGRLDDLEAARMERLLLEIRERKDVEKLESDLATTKQNLKDSKEEVLKLRATTETLERNFKSSLTRAQSVEASVSSKEENSKQTIAELEATYKEKLNELETERATLQAELDEKKKEISYTRSYFGTDGVNERSRDDLEAELKKLHEKSIVQARMIHSMQKKIEVLEQGKEKLYEAKRQEILKDHSEINSLRKENTRLREKVNKVICERRAMQEQLESFAKSIGSSMHRFNPLSRKDRSNGSPSM